MPGWQLISKSALLLALLTPLVQTCQAAPEQSEIQKDRQALQTALGQFPAGAATGILIPAGGREQLTNCAALVILLREHYLSQLPIEVFYNGRAEHYPPALELLEVIPSSPLQLSVVCCEQDPSDKLRLFDLSPGSRAYMFGQGYPGVRCTDASLFSQPLLHRNVSISGYGFKVFALYMSSFDKVLLLDSDNVPLLEPAQLLAEHSFQRLGNLFWRDYFQRSGWNVPPPEGVQLACVAEWEDLLASAV